MGHWSQVTTRNKTKLWHKCINFDYFIVMLIERLREWKENVESKGMRVNMNKTKVMMSGERQMVRQKAARWPCGVCNKGVGSNSLQCTRCQKWIRNAVV